MREVGLAGVCGGRAMRLSLAWFVACMVSAPAWAAPVRDIPGWNGSIPVDLSRSPAVNAWQPAIAAGAGEDLIVAWSDPRTVGEPHNIYTTLSSDGGRTWSGPQVVTDTAANSRLPDALIVGGRTVVAWSDETSERTFTLCDAQRDTPVSAWSIHCVPGPTSYASTRPRLAYGQGWVYMVYSAGSEQSPDIVYASRRLTDTAWSMPETVYTHTALYGSHFPALGVGADGQTVHVAWEERTSATVGAIMYLSGTLDAGSVSWRYPAEELSVGTARVVWPSVAVDADGNVHVVWARRGDPRQYDVFHRRLDAVHGTWSTPKTIAVPVGVNAAIPNDVAPRIVASQDEDGVRVCVAWHGYQTGQAGQAAEEVLLSCSRDGGGSWSPPVTVSRTPGGEEISMMPDVAVDAAGQLHLAWQERAGPSPVYDYQIYYARSMEPTYIPFCARNSVSLPLWAVLPRTLRTE